MSEQGTGNFYELDLQSLDELRRYLDGFWDASLASFKQAAETATEEGVQ